MSKLCHISIKNNCFFKKKKWANPGLFFLYFRSFQTNNTIFTTNQCGKMSKCPSTIRRRDSNPRSFERESSLITTRPWVPHKVTIGLPYLSLSSIIKFRPRVLSSTWRSTALSVRLASSNTRSQKEVACTSLVARY